MAKKESNKRDYKRDKDIFELREKGMTFREIGKKYGICAQRARALYCRKKEERGVYSIKQQLA